VTVEALPSLRVLQVIGTAITGGMEVYVGQLLDRLPGWIECTVVAPGASEVTERWRDRGHHVHMSPMNEDAHVADAVERVVEIARRTGAQLIHSHLSNANAVCAVASAIVGVPAIATMHGRHLTLRDVEVLTFGRQHALVVCEAALAQALLLGIDAARVTLVPNGVDTVRFVPRARPANAPLTVAYVGRLAPEKEPVDFVRVAAAVARTMPGVRFCMIGDGALRGDVRECIARSGLCDRVEMRGLVADMHDVYRDLDVVVSTSSMEGMPLALLEAMACGVPVVATAVGGVPELVCNGVTGRVVPVGAVDLVASAVCELARDAALRARMGAAARARVLRRFDARDQIERIAALMCRLCNYAGPERSDARISLHVATRS